MAGRFALLPNLNSRMTYFYLTTHFTPIPQAAIIGLWAWLFTGTLTQPGKIFAWLKQLGGRMVSLSGKNRFVVAEYHALFECPVCHAGQVCLLWQVGCLFTGQGFDPSLIVVSLFAAALAGNFLKL